MHKRNVNDFSAPEEAEFLSANGRRAGWNKKTDGRNQYQQHHPEKKSACFKCQGFCLLIDLEPTVENDSCSHKNATHINDNNEKITYRALQRTDHSAPQVVIVAIVMLIHLLLATPDSR